MKIKIWLSLLFTLMIGFALGFVVSRGISINHLEKTKQFTTQKGLIRKYFHIVKPDSSQRRKLAPILDRYGYKIQSESKKYRKELNIILDSIREETKPILRPEQIERLDNAKRFFNYRKGHNKKRNSRSSHHRQQHPPHNSLHTRH